MLIDVKVAILFYQTLSCIIVCACSIPLVIFLLSYLRYKLIMTEHVNAVALKLPTFWPNLPAHWFLQVESQFRTRGITVAKTKYDYVISSLSQDAVATVYDVMAEISASQDTDQPIADPYEHLKRYLIERHTQSESSRIETLLSGLEMGDKKPSEFFRSLKSLAGSSEVVNDKLVLSLWMRRLPPMVQASLKAVPKAEISDQISMADNIFEIFQQHHPQSPSISAMSNFEPSNDAIPNLIAQNRRLEREVAEIKGMISRLTANSGDSRPNAGHSNRSRSRSRTQSNTQSRSQSRGGDLRLCWYHAKFGDRASKCKEPCNFKPSPN